MESAGRLLEGGAHGGDDVVGLGPRTAQDLGEQAALAGDDRPTVDDDVELPVPSLLELDRRFQLLANEGSETRCLFSGVTSGLAVDDLDGHAKSIAASGDHPTIEDI